jgi:peptidoglycan/xylan/chitin deacetylase (PgdA/CDA1 family)
MATIPMIERTIRWPEGKRCAAAITFDIDTDSFLHLEFGDKLPDLVCTNSWVRYDEVAIPRILGMFREYGLRQSFFYPAWCMETYPHLVEMILRDGHEIGHHGWMHESPNRLTAEDELTCLQRGIETIRRMTGRKPRGFRAPLYNMSRNTARFLAQEGIVYDASLMGDDMPYLIESEVGRLIELPASWNLDDWPQYVQNMDINYLMPIKAPARAMEVFLAEFEAAYKYGGLWIATWHPWVSGRLAQCDAIAGMIEYMLSKGDVWFATMEEIAAHVQSQILEGSYDPRVVRLPYYTDRLPAADIPVQRS